jgi:hypothetical protein
LLRLLILLLITCGHLVAQSNSALTRQLTELTPSTLELPTTVGESGKFTFDWNSAARQTFGLLLMEHSLRMVQRKTRAQLGGRFFPEWFASAGNIHGWTDDDSILTNHVGHPIHSSWAGYIQIQNDPKGRMLQFENSQRYWNSRLKALGWAQFYELQWHLGPLSEASIGNVGRPGTKTLGWVNIVSSAPEGIGLIVVEDWLDKHVLAKIERNTNSLPKRRFYRMLFNPSRSMANVFRWKKPWYRDYRSISDPTSRPDPSE